MHFSPILKCFCSTVIQIYPNTCMALVVYDAIQHHFCYSFKKMRLGKSSFIITMYVISIHIHFTQNVNNIKMLKHTQYSYMLRK